MVTKASWPAWSVVHLVGSAAEFSVIGTIRYPGGETIRYPGGDTWHVVAPITVRDGKIWRETDYFAAPFDAPDWRLPYRESGEQRTADPHAVSGC
ncbi:MAG: hypothetical protein H0U13_01660 [Gemmatimonadaceae bacterium]|nr:hypothetical protein [Gemmatimonadaceae bacterium]